MKYFSIIVALLLLSAAQPALAMGGRPSAGKTAKEEATCPPELLKRFIEAEAVVMGTLKEAEFLPIPIPAFASAKYGKKFHLENFKLLHGKKAESLYVRVIVLDDDVELFKHYSSAKGQRFVFLSRIGHLPDNAPESSIKKHRKSWYSTTNMRDVLLADNPNIQSCLNHLDH